MLPQLVGRHKSGIAVSELKRFGLHTSEVDIYKANVHEASIHSFGASSVLVVRFRSIIMALLKLFTPT